jgi:hypothetical protein
MHFWRTHVDVDEEMENVKEIEGMNSQSETLMQSEISSMFLPTLKFRNLGQLHPHNPISQRKCISME